MVVPGPHGPDVLIADLGSDRIWRTRLDQVAGRLAAPAPAVVAAPGTGPRHLRRLGDGTLLVSGELAPNLSWYTPGGPDVTWQLGGTAPASTTSGENYPSELTAGADGRFVYMANRGPDTVSAYSWDGAKAELIAEVPTGGAWPRHLALLGDHLYVANERSHSVTTFRVDRDTGIPGIQGEPTSEPSPTCVLRWNPVSR
jgi:6-phosphogluconolactonase (cycloisomerase 2 family)